MLYDGDLHQHDKILTWLTSQDIFEIKNEIEEVNRKMLDKLLEENEFLTVYFCKFDLMLLLIRVCVFNEYFYINIKQMSLAIRKAQLFWKNWRTSTVKRTIWILHLSKWPTLDMRVNGVSRNCQLLCTSENASLAYTEVRNSKVNCIISDISNISNSLF